MFKRQFVIITFLIFIMFISLYAQTLVAVKPVGQVSSIYNNGKMDFANSTTSFSLTGTDLLSDIKLLMCKIDDNKYTEYKAPISIKEEGLHTIYYYSVDNVGNQTPEVSYSVFIDNIAPEVMLISSIKLFALNNKLYAPASAEFTIIANDIGSGIKSTEYSLDKGNYIPYASGIKITATGEHIIKYKAMDNLGNASAGKVFSVCVDNNKPLVTITPSGTLFEKNKKKFASSSFQYSIEATDTESQIAKLLVSIDGGNYVIYENPFVLSGEGEHTIKAKAIDNVGNESDEISLIFTIDTTPPKIELKPVK